MRPEVAQLINQTWTAEAASNGDDFEKVIRSVANSYLAKRRKGDITAANDWLECLMGARQLAFEEPLASIYADYLAMVSANMADWLVCQHKFAEAAEVAAHAWESLNAKDARRAALGLPRADSMMSRSRLLGVLADAKWRMPGDQLRDVVLTPTQLLQAWVGYAQSHQNKSGPLPPEASPLERRNHHETDKRHSESLLWSGLWTACCAYRYCRSDLVRLVREFNILYRRHYRSAGLAISEGHWKEDAPLAPDSPLYWHFEIAKHWLGSQKALAAGRKPAAFDTDDLEELYSQLLLSVERWTEGRPDKVYADGLKLDYRWMRDALNPDPDAANSAEGGKSAALLEGLADMAERSDHGKEATATA
jgi:hypothetical protein